MNFRLLGVLLVLGAVVGSVYFLNLQQSVDAQRAAARMASFYQASGNSEILQAMPEIRSSAAMDADEQRSKTGLLICIAAGFVGMTIAVSAKRGIGRRATDAA